MHGVSIVIPCYNPEAYLLEAIATARAQRGCPVEVVLVNDGSDLPGARKVLENARALADRCLDQPHRGLAAARNAGFDAASHEWIIPLDADDMLEPEYATACLDALNAHPGAAFAYSDYRVFGKENYVERLPDYNLYQLLDRNIVTYAALIRKSDWAAAGGYDESMTPSGYEDWEFWLNLGARGRHGEHIRRVLFGYRKHGPSLIDIARERHAALTACIRAKHPELYEYDARARVKALWSPAVAVVADKGQIRRQSILDWQAGGWQRIGTAPGSGAIARGPSECPAFLVARSPSLLAAESAELAALAVWGGNDAVELADGSVALSRRGFEQNLVPRPTAPAVTAAPLPPRLETIHRHLANAGLLSLEAWTRHPLRSSARLIPLRIKEQVNRISGRRIFDLDFYLQFQPSAVNSGGLITAPLIYMPEARASRRRIGLITPHLGPGGAERVLLELAGALDPATHEVFLIATQSTGDSWRGQWEKRAEHIYDLRKLMHPEKLAAGIYSICINWELDALVVQNSLSAYSVLPQIKERLPGLRSIDLIHSVDADWNLVAATRAVDAALDVRVALSASVRRELVGQGIEEGKIRLILNGVDLECFAADAQCSTPDYPHRILFAGRLEAVKRPLLLVEIGRRLRLRRGCDDFRFVVVGDGPEAAGLHRRLRAHKLERLFEFRGQVADIAPELASCEVVVLPSKAEGIPLIVLEAFAASRPVVASAVGGVPEVVTPENGILIPPGGPEVENFAAALDRLLSDRTLRLRLGSNGRSTVEEKFDRRRAVEEYRSLFEFPTQDR
ncbi:MAG TPA: glycosyltransferase [Bryobacteraceae bacterium]|jgi:glycosyltransferase involved in cell wall biosynthesis